MRATKQMIQVKFEKDLHNFQFLASKLAVADLSNSSKLIDKLRNIQTELYKLQHLSTEYSKAPEELVLN